MLAKWDDNIKYLVKKMLMQPVNLKACWYSIFTDKCLLNKMLMQHIYWRRCWYSIFTDKYLLNKILMQHIYWRCWYSIFAEENADIDIPIRYLPIQHIGWIECWYNIFTKDDDDTAHLQIRWLIKKAFLLAHRLSLRPLGSN